VQCIGVPLRELSLQNPRAPSWIGRGWERDKKEQSEGRKEESGMEGDAPYLLVFIPYEILAKA